MRFKHDLTIFLATLLLLIAGLPVMAQSREVKGTVFEPDGQATIVGATVILKGTTVGTNTDVNGEFTLNVSGENPVLIVQYVGYLRQEIAVGDLSVVNVILQEDIVQLGAVVVTALGITREEKSLGYAVSTVDNDVLTKSVAGNWLSNMSGKVAGLTFDQAGSGPTGSKRVTLRGDHSLTYGKNTVLFVIDGVAVGSSMVSTSSGSNYASQDSPVDFGNAASDINPDDIESVSVLKGAASTALYGSRAGNGAIIITTKSGRKDKGIGVSVNSSVVLERAGYWPDFQTEYGSGSDMGMSEYCFWNLTSDMAPDGIATTRKYSRYAFGEKFDSNKLRYQYASKNWDTNEYTRLPWEYQDDWYTGLFQTGVTYNNTVSIDGGNGKGTSTRLSFTDTRNEWILPNTGYNKQTVSLSYNSEVNKYIKIAAKVNYIKKGSDNMPVSGYDETSAMYSLVWGYNSSSIDDWKNEYFGGRYNYDNYSNTEGTNGQSLVFPSSSSYNPYRTLYEELNTQDKDRIYGNLDVTFTILEGLTLDLRTGLDWDDEFRTMRKPYYTTDWVKGFYREQTIRTFEINSDFLLRYMNNKLVGDRFGLSVAFGGNRMDAERYQSRISLSELGIEGKYNTTNLPAGVAPDPYNYRSGKRINSLYAMTSLSWDDTYFVDITGRSDWSSTIAPQNLPYVYPSVAASVLLNNIFKFEDNAPWIDFMKLRLSWANVGNDTDPYSLDAYYKTSSFPGGYTVPDESVDKLIEPENTASWELGLEAKLLKNRVSFDLALYNSSSTDQIYQLKTDQITGSILTKINTGEIQNKGVEVSARFVPIDKKDFNWTFDISWSKNINKLVSVSDNWDPKEQLVTDIGTTIGGRTYIYSFVGEEMQQIYGRGYQRAPKGSYYTDGNGNQVDCSGMKLVDANGFPILDTNPDRRIGKVNPDWKAGMTHTFTYKNLSLSATFTGQLGGNCYSVTNFSLSYQGKLKNSLPGRYDGLVVDGVNQVSNGDTYTYNKNNTVTSNIQTYYNSIVWNRNNTEENTFGTSFLKMTELRLDYRIPAKICQQTKVLQNASMGIFATNLFCISDFPQYDPETGMMNGSEIYKGIEAMSFPMTRSYGFNIKLSF